MEFAGGDRHDREFFREIHDAGRHLAVAAVGEPQLQ